MRIASTVANFYQGTQSTGRSHHPRIAANRLSRQRTRETTRATGPKRLLDISVATTGLVALLPVFAIVAVLIKLSDGGPILFWQMRVGGGGKEFLFPKFRSMVVNAEQLKETLKEMNHHSSGVTFKMKRDPRVTWIGRVLRTFSIDELPQLWNVFLGQMSLVGPRPAVPQEVAQYSDRENRRLHTTPGLTCFWQIGGRADISFDQQVEMDIRYIESQTFLLDLWILLQTVPAVIRGKGAY